MQMSIHVRSRNNGKSYELRIKHRLLDRAFYATLESAEEAQRLGERALVELNRGTVPPWMRSTREAQSVCIAKAISDYRAIRAVPASTRNLLDTIANEIGSRLLSEVNYAWAEQWIGALKREKRIAPGTIRKKKGQLSRVFDWVVKAHPLWLSANPLRDLPHGYSGYDEFTRKELEREGLAVPEDEERNRRISPSEEQQIVDALRLRVLASYSVEIQAQAEAMSLMIELALCTAMRMRELYTLTMDQISIPMKTIFLDKTKNGDRRQVPLSTKAIAVLQKPRPALEKERQGSRLLPFWDGSLREEDLEDTTRNVSLLYSRLFKRLKLHDLHFHDARHEGLCRWVLEAPQPLTSEQLGRAAGMRDARTRQRYLSLRGSELADMLG
jgi:integrase